MELRGEKGQGLVEYILLLAVAVSLVVTFYHTNFYKNMFGAQGTLAVTMKSATEFGYRNAFMSGRNPTPQGPAPYDPVTHPSYKGINGEGTRFFGPQDPYPR